MTALLARLAAPLGYLLSLARPLAAPSIRLPLAVPVLYATGPQVAFAPVLPGDYTPSTGGEP